MHKTILAAATVLCLGAASASAANVVETADQAGTFKTLLAAAQAAGLADALATTTNITVFAPTDEAFAKLPAGTVENLLKPENKDQLIKVLTYHVVPGAVTSDQLAGKRMDVATVEGSTVHVNGTNGVRVNNARVTQADIIASNGVIHRIDRVLLPK